MAVNFNMLRQAGPANFYEGLVQGQEQQRANALTQQKMAQEQQKMAQEQEMNALQMQQTRGAISQQERQVKAQNAAQKTAMFRERLLRAPNPNSVRDLVKMQYADPDLGPILAQTGTLEQALAEVPDDPVQFERHRQQEALGMSEWMKSQLPKTVGNAIYKPATDTFVSPERAPAPLGAPVAVMGPDGKPRYVSREEAIGMTPFTPATVKFMGGGGATAAPAPKPMTPVQAATRRDKLGKEFKTVQNALQTTQDVIDSIAFVKDEPGLSRATGFTGTLLPSFPEGAAASAEARLKNLEGKVTALGKAQASATGAIGSIATQEWQVLRDQIAALDRSKGTGPLLKQLELVEAQARGAMERMKDAYQRQFGEDFEQFPQFADMPAPKSTFKPKGSASDKKDSGGGTGGFKYLGKEGG